METPHATMNLMGDEIGELRKYIVEMMHAERELMESIKLNESNVAAANVRIKQLKELISQERVRYKTLKMELAGDTEELKRLEEQQIVAEAKHQQFKADVAQHESEVQELRTRFQHQRAALLNLRHQIMDATTRLEKLSSRGDSVDEEMRDVTSVLEECSEPTEQRAASQKLRAKIRYTQQFIVQMEEETGQLVERRTKLETEVLQCEQEAHKLRESVFTKEQEAEVLFGRLRQDTLRIIRENGKVEGKLKAKRRKFRLKTKNEINSLKRRVSFISSELERGQMTNEDVLSNIDALGLKREELERKLSERNEELASVEGTIAELSESMSSFGRGEENYDTTNLQEQLAAKREDALLAQKKLDEKKNFLQLLEADQSQLNSTLEDMSAQIVAAKKTAEKLDNEITSLAKDIEEQEARGSSLRASVNDAKQKNDDLLAEYQAHQRMKKNNGKTQAKLRRQRDSLLKQEQQLASELREAENLSRILGEGIQHGMEYASQVKESSAPSESKENRIEFELRRRELSLQQQCAQEETKFQAEVTGWDDKIKRVEQQLRSL